MKNQNLQSSLTSNHYWLINVKTRCSRCTSTVYLISLNALALQLHYNVIAQSGWHFIVKHSCVAPDKTASINSDSELFINNQNSIPLLWNQAHRHHTHYGKGRWLRLARIEFSIHVQSFETHHHSNCGEHSLCLSGPHFCQTVGVCIRRLCAAAYSVSLSVWVHVEDESSVWLTPLRRSPACLWSAYGQCPDINPLDGQFCNLRRERGVPALSSPLHSRTRRLS